MASAGPDPKTLFWEVLDQPSEAERRACLDRACGDDTILRARLDALLKAHKRVGNFLESPILASTVHLEAHPPEEGPGTLIGPYTLLEKVGEGGMGVVYMAEQAHPVRRRVALKVIKPGMDTRQVVARFEAEHQALALMDHPNIAKVLDAGTTGPGRPYFVMELVKGVPITEYCDVNGLTLRERLELFIPVCQAIGHAHRAGVIHRDITPSNVLVTLVDDEPVPKVIDFGVAKEFNQRLAERTPSTQFGSIIGTLEYMSPEQAAAVMRDPDIDTRSDIYSLGVLLYELVTGSTPLRRASLVQEPCDEILRRIREEDPTKPSVRLGESEEGLAILSKRRRTEPTDLMRQVNGSLDRIVMMALEKDRARRYLTAREMACEIEHHLSLPQGEEKAPATVLWKVSIRESRPVAIATILAALICVLLLIKFPRGLWSPGADVATDQRTQELPRVVPSPPPPPSARELAFAEIEKMGGVIKRKPALVVEFHDARTRLSDEGLARLSSSFEVLGPIQLNLSGTNVTDAGLKALARLSRLKVLFLAHTSISGAGLAHLKGMHGLERLELGWTDVTDADLMHLAGLARLNHLALRNTKVTGSGLVSLKGLKQLATLYLYDAQITDEGLEAVEGMPQLTELILHGARITDEGLKHLAGLKQLKRLHLGGTRITDEGLKHLKALTRLRVLYLGGTRITDAGLEHLKPMSQLETLDLVRSQITERGISDLKKHLPGLKVVTD